MTMQPLFSDDERKALTNTITDQNGIYTLDEALTQSVRHNHTSGLAAAIATLPPSDRNPSVSDTYVEFVPEDGHYHYSYYAGTGEDNIVRGEADNLEALKAVLVASGRNPDAPIWHWSKVAE